MSRIGRSGALGTGRVYWISDPVAAEHFSQGGSGGLAGAGGRLAWIEEWVGNEEIGKEQENVFQEIALDQGLPYTELLECPEKQWARARRVSRRKSLAPASQRKDSRLEANIECRSRNWKSGQRFEFCFSRLFFMRTLTVRPRQVYSVLYTCVFSGC